MAKSMYVGVDNLARKIKKAYVGIDGVARKIKKAYVGVNGIARSIMSTDLLEYYGEIEGFNYMFCLGHSAYGTIGNYLLCVGGTNDYNTYVDAYSTSLVHSTPTDLSEGVAYPEYASVGKYALFAGGEKSSSSITSKVHAYNTSLTYSNPTSLGSSRNYLAGASVGNYALFAGGSNTSGSTVYSTVYAYNTSLTRSTATALNEKRRSISGASVGNYALFAGGCGASSSGNYDVVDAYSTSLVHSIPTSLSKSDLDMPAPSVGNYVLFSLRIPKVLNVYSSTLVRTIITTDRSLNVGSSLNKYAVFGASDDTSNGRIYYYYLYNNNLVRNIQQSSHSGYNAIGFKKANCMFSNLNGKVHVYKEN